MAATVIVASAGSGKTTRLVSEASGIVGGRILMTTYTIENTETIRRSLVERFGCVPSNIEVCTWYSVLLAHGVRPYQNLVSPVELSKAIAFVDLPDSARFANRTDVSKRFFAKSGDIYKDRLSEFTCFTDDQTKGLVIQRLEGIYTHILIDELQDMTGYDLDLLSKLFRSNVSVIAVGDPRQATYTTNRSSKNSGVSGVNLHKWIAAQQKAGTAHINELSECQRSNQIICDFADALYPHLPSTRSLNEETTEHDGVFEIPLDEALAYAAKHRPIVLRWDKSHDTLGLSAINIGISKGSTYDRVLIFTTGPMKKYLRKRDPSALGDMTKAKLYVAVTRARYSAAFVV